MTRKFRQSQSLLHTWSGLLMGWLLFVVFVTGTIAFYREGMNRWMRPELAPVTRPETVLAGAQRFLSVKAADAQSWYITLASAQSPGAQLFWVPAAKPGEGRRHGRGRRDTQALIGADGQPAIVRETRGGDFFYRFHFDLHYMPVIWARWAVGLAAMMMLVAILSGVVTHKRIFRDFFCLRRGKGQRSWLDGHNAVAVLALPFHLMITYTGLVTLAALLMPWAMVASYQDPTAISEVLFPHVKTGERTGEAAPLVDLRTVLHDAERRFGAPAGAMEVSQPGDRAAHVTVFRSAATMLNTRTPSLAYDGVTGRLVWRAPLSGGAAVTAGVMIGVHAGRFADAALRFLYFLGGVAGTLMVATGLVLWTVKRREKLPDPARPHFGFKLVEQLNVAVIAGFSLGIAAMLWANRLLPVDMAGRAQWEVHWLFIAWAFAGMTVLAIGPRRTWVGVLGTTGVLLGLLPVWNMVMTDRGLIATIWAGDGMLAGIDVGLLVFGGGFVAMARRVARHRVPARRSRIEPVSADQIRQVAMAAQLEPAE